MAVDTFVAGLSVGNNAASVVAGPAVLTGYVIGNLSQAAMYYVKLYDKASSPTVGTDVPVMTLGIPPLSGPHEGLSSPIEFALGIAYAATSGSPDGNSGSIPVNTIVSNLMFDTA